MRVLLDFFIKIAIVLITVFIGFVLYKEPGQTLKKQSDFYRRINYKMEPISMDKELKNMKRTGILVILCGLVAIFII